MTKVQNRWTNRKNFSVVFLILIANVQIFAQSISFDHEVSMLALGDSYMQFQNDSAEFEQIKTIFYQQEKDWNRGDIDAFMKAYWNSEAKGFPHTRFVLHCTP